MNHRKPGDIDTYIDGFPKEIQKVLQLVRQAISETAPQARETIKYGMPTFTLSGNLVYFGAFKNHLGFYPAPTDDKEFEAALSGYKTGRGSIQFPYNRPIPLDLIKKIVKWRIEKTNG